jgi:hypothetical protein
VKDNDLSQMGSSKVFFDEYDGQPCVTKNDITVVEHDFYTKSAPSLTDFARHTPKIYSINSQQIKMEAIPHPVAQGDLKAADVFILLNQLHSYQNVLVGNTHSHRWSESDTRNALLNLDLPQSSADILVTMQQTQHSLFRPNSIISGDTNAGNWGRRDNGLYVLFDWERFGYGCPTIDLAPLVNGMGSLSDLESTIERYAAYGSSNLPGDPLKNLILAKAWIAVEVTNILVTRNHANADQYLKWYQQTLPDWLDRVSSRL